VWAESCESFSNLRKSCSKLKQSAILTHECKTNHSKGTVTHADYWVELARIREAVAETVHWLPQDLWMQELETVSPSDNMANEKLGPTASFPWKKWLITVGSIFEFLPCRALSCRNEVKTSTQAMLFESL